MLVLIRGPEGRLYHLDFGDPADVARSAAQLIPWVLDDYERRRDALWDVGPLQGQEELAGRLAELWAFPSVLCDALRAMRFYALACPESERAERCLAHSDKAVRLAALGAIGSMAYYPLGRDLKSFLDSADSDERREAANAFSKFGNDDAADTLRARAASDPEFEPYAVQAEERRDIARSRNPQGLVVPMLDSEDYEDLCIFAPFCREQIVAVLRLPSAPELIRLRAARVLGLTRQRPAGAVALAILEQEPISPEFRDTLVWLLGRVRRVQALPTLHAALASASGDYELVLIEAIGQIRNQKSLGILLNHLDQRRNAPVIAAVRAALWRISSSVMLEEETWYRPRGEAEASWVYVVSEDGRVETDDPGALIEPELSSDSAARRRDAIFALGQLPRTPARQQQLQDRALRDPDDQARETAERVLRMPPFPP